MDIDLLSDSPDQVSPSFSSNLLQYSPRRLISDTRDQFGEGLPLLVARPALQPRPQNSTADSGGVISKIAIISGAITGCIIDGEAEIGIEMKSRGRKTVVSDAHGDMDARQKRQQMTRFPSRCPSEARRFAMLHRILELSNEAIVTGIITTKRDIYYQEPELFTTQSVVNRYVDDISYTLGTNRDALNVVAAAKGLIVGDLSITRKGGTVLQYWSELDGLLVPKVDDLEDMQIGGARWILVVEKEATFRTLAACEHWRGSSAGNGILITAKGYPDVQTRQFLHFLSTTFPHIPIFALLDFDPDGIGIMSTYKHGSKSLAHETKLNVPSIQWLGVRSSDAMTETNRDGLLPLTKRDRNLAKKMLGKKDIDQEWRRELQLMLMLNVKAEIQILGNEEQLGVWLDRRLSSAMDDDKVEVQVDADGDILML